MSVVLAVLVRVGFDMSKWNVLFILFNAIMMLISSIFWEVSQVVLFGIYLIAQILLSKK